MRCHVLVLTLFSWSLLLWPSLLAAQDSPFFSSELVFPLEHWHNHSSSVVELPNGDLFVAWFHGSGERSSDDVVIHGARRNKQAGKWTKPFLLADSPGFPDTNCVLYLDSKARLWLFWPVIIANTWESALMKYRVSSDYLQPDGPPKWDRSDNIILIPKNIAERTQAVFGRLVGEPGIGARASEQIGKANDKFFSRMGWFTRNHPVELASGRMLVPMYSDGYSFSLVAVSDDGSETFYASEPIVGFGNIQPALAVRKNGEIVAYMRDAGPPPKRIQTAVSKDDGLTWSTAVDTEIPNPGSSCQVRTLKSGLWVLVYNDTERGRHSLAVSLSDDEGKTWKWTRHVERDAAEAQPSTFHYPSLWEAKDGTLLLTYSYFINRLPPDAPRKSIKHAHFNVEWIKQGDQ
jgi:predicted neuraminidase